MRCSFVGGCPHNSTHAVNDRKHTVVSARAGGMEAGSSCPPTMGLEDMCATPQRLSCCGYLVMTDAWSAQAVVAQCMPRADE